MLLVIFIFWGLGIGDWGLGPIPNPQSPIPYFNLCKIMLNIILNIILKVKNKQLLIIK